VFSLGWGLPPAWGCIPEQPDSGGQQRPTRGRRDPNLHLPHEALTLRGTPFQGISWRPDAVMGTTWCEIISLRFSWTIVSAPDTPKSRVLFQAYNLSSG